MDNSELSERFKKLMEFIKTVKQRSAQVAVMDYKMAGAALGTAEAIEKELKQLFPELIEG